MRPLISITSNNLQVGGAERQRIVLANGLADRGYSVSLVLLQSGGLLESLVADRVKIRHQPWFRPRWRTSGTPEIMITGTTNTEVGHGVLWRYGRPGARRRWLVAAHDPPVVPGPTYERPRATAMRFSDRMIALSPTQWHELTANQRLSGSTAFYIPNGVRLRTDTATASPVSPSDDLLQVIFVGRLVEHKGVQVALAALASFPERPWRFDIFGDGDYRQTLEAMVPAELADRVTFHGSVTDPIGHALNADLMVLPSRAEAQPMALLEAMAAGIPVMAQGVAAVPEMLADGAGIVVPDQSVEQWQAALATVFDGDADLAALRQAGRERVSQYSVATMLDRYEEAFRAVLG